MLRPILFGAVSVGTKAMSPNLHAQLHDLLANPLTDQAALTSVLRKLLLEDDAPVVEESSASAVATESTPDPLEFAEIVPTTVAPETIAASGSVALTNAPNIDSVVSSISAFLDEEERLLAQMLSTTSTTTLADSESTTTTETA